MRPKPPAILRTVRRGEGLDELHLIDAEGRVVIVVVHAVRGEDRLRTRETALRLLSGATPS